MERAKEFIKKLKCNHQYASVERWCIKHISNSEPSCVVAEYKCDSCGKYLYVYLKGKDKESWINAMGDYKKENFNCER